MTRKTPFVAALFAAYLLAPQPANAATLTVTVVDSNYGAPVAGAQVFLGTNGRGDVTLTDAEGIATLEVSSTDDLIITAAVSESTQVFYRPIFNTRATTVLHASGADVRIAVGPYQFSDVFVADTFTNDVYDGTVSGLDTTVPGGWAVRSPSSLTSGELDATSPEAGFSVSAPVGQAPFLFAAQLEADAEGLWSSTDTPLRFGVVYDAAPGANIPLDATFASTLDLAVEGLSLTPSEAGLSLCADLVLNFPEGRGSLGFNGSCTSTAAGATSGQLGLMAPDLAGPLSGASYGLIASAIDSEGGQTVAAPAFTITDPDLVFMPRPDPSAYEPLSLQELPGTSIQFDGDEQALREIVVFNETHIGPGGFIHSNTNWTVVNHDPSQALVFPRVPRDADVPALGARLPVIGNQTAVAIAEYRAESLSDYILSFTYLDTFVPSEPEPPTGGEVRGVTGR